MRPALVAGSVIVLAAIVYLGRGLLFSRAQEPDATAVADVVPPTRAQDGLLSRSGEPARTAQLEERVPQSYLRVVHPDGAGIGGAEVRWVEIRRADLDLEPAWRADGWGPLERRTLVVETDEAGSFVFDEDPRAELGALLWAAKVGFEASVLRLGPGEALASAPRELVLERTAPVTVRVVDGTGEAVAGASVHHYGTSPSRTSAAAGNGPSVESLLRLLAASTATGADGVALFPGFPGEDVFVASAAGATSLPWRGEEPRTVELVLRDDFTVAGTLAVPTRIDPEREGEQRIRIVSSHGGVERTLVTLRAVEDGPWGPVDVPHLPQCNYSARLEGAPLVPDVIEFDSPGPGKHLEIRFDGRLGHDLTFRAVDASGAVIHDSEVFLKWRKGGARCWMRHRADADGILRPRGVAEGAVHYHLGAPGFATFVSDVALQVPLDSPGTITVRLEAAGTLRGEVRHDGRPVPDFTLWAWHRDVPTDNRSRTFLDREDGSFEWDELPLGEVLLTAAGIGTASSVPTPVRVTREPGEPIRIEVPGAIGGFGTLVSGVSGLPIAGARVEVLRRTSIDTSAGMGRRASSASDGSFEVSGLGPGSNWLYARAPGFAHAVLPVEVSGDGPVDLGEQVLWTDQDLVVELAGPPEGFDPAAYQVSTNTGAPSQAFGPDGRARFESVRPGLVNISIKKPQGGWIDLVTELLPGRDAVVRHHLGHGGRLTLEVEPAPDYDASAGFSAYVLYQDPRGVYVTTGFPLNAQGPTTLAGIDGDEVLVQVLRKGDWAVVGTGRGSFAGRKELHLVVRAGADRLTVRVVDAGGEPLAGVEVSFGQPGPPELYLFDQTDSEGRASLWVPDEPGLIRLAHDVLGTREGVPWPGGSGELELVLSSDASVQVLVLAGELPLRGATCRTTWLNGYRFGHPRRTDDEGRACVTGLSEGDVRLRIEHPSLLRTEVPAQASSSPELVEVRMPELGVLTLEVLGAGGAPARGARLALRSLSLGEDVSRWIDAGRVLGTLVANESGEVRLEGLPEGEYAWSTTDSAVSSVSVLDATSSRFALRPF